MATFARDLQTLVRLARPRRHALHAEWLDAFYAPQAAGYDDFRERLLPGRADLISDLPLAPGAVWVDLGGGTGRNLDFAGPRLPSLARTWSVDLSRALQRVARDRCRARGWANVMLVRADAGAVPLPTGVADVVTCSYALTMMPGWRRTIDEMARLLRPGGTIGVVDFHVSAVAGPPGRDRHGWATRTFWPWWFAHSRVYLSPARLTALLDRFETVSLVEGRHRLPWLPGSRVPFFRCVGRLRPADPGRIQWPARCTTSSPSCSAAAAGPGSFR